MAGRDPFAMPPERARMRARPPAAPDEDEDAPRRVGLGLAQLDGTPPEQVEQAVVSMRSQGKRPAEITDTFVQSARQSAVQENARMRAEARQKYADEMQRAKAEAEAESRTQFVFRAIGDIASAATGGPTNPVTDRVTEQRATRRKQAEGAAGRTFEMDMGEVDARRQDERDVQQGTLFDQGQEDRTQGREGMALRARGLADELGRAGIKFPQELIDRDPKGFVDEFGPRFKTHGDREFSVEGREDQQSHDIDMELLRETREKGKGSDATANAQLQLFQRADKYDKVNRQQLQSLDRALDQRINGAKDIELLYNFIARMDNTAAREGELDLARKAQDLLDRLQTLIGNVTEGQLISDDLRAQIREQISITRTQIQEDRGITLGGLRAIGADLGVAPSLLQQLDAMQSYGSESTVPQEYRPQKPAVTPPERQVQQLPTAAGAAPAPTQRFDPNDPAVRDAARAERARRRGAQR